MVSPHVKVLALYRFCKSTLVSSILSCNVSTYTFTQTGMGWKDFIYRFAPAASNLQGAQEDPSPRQHQGEQLSGLPNIQLRRRARVT